MTTNDSPTLTGIIGGSGLYGLDLDNVREVTLSTPFGDPSGPVTIGELLGVPVAFLARHGKGHHISPTEVPSKGQHLRLQAVGGGAPHLRECGGQPQAGDRSSRHGRARSADRPDAVAGEHVLRQRFGRAYTDGGAVLPRVECYH